AAALARDCAAEIDAEGGIQTRNPEELLEVFTLLTWAAQALAEAGPGGTPAHLAAIERIAPALRALRHADGGLARFHGGGRGLAGRLDLALANAGVKALAHPGLTMGFARLSGGRTSVVVDAADPPGGRAGRLAHASTLAFELTSGRRPVVVNCGSGTPFGPAWQRASRATASHSTLAIEGFSSSRFGARSNEALVDSAHVVLVRQAVGEAGHHLVLAQDGWSATHGLTHSR
ncbi:MAG: heparinase, partial [Nitrospirae bacterium CG_4_9_14_3_um_filter_51_5]